MTRERAIAVAEAAAARTGEAVVVYRFPAWQAGVFGVLLARGLPPEAERYEVIDPAVPPPQPGLFDGPGPVLAFSRRPRDNA